MDCGAGRNAELDSRQRIEQKRELLHSLASREAVEAAVEAAADAETDEQLSASENLVATGEIA
jgi:hypothetical protein